jgi:nucleoside-diphosphate-sugar epimerase
VGLQVTEEAKVDLTQGRVEGEEYLREHGATCLVLAGIYGDERQPSSWLLRGTHHHTYREYHTYNTHADTVSVGAGLIKNGNKHVNLVHVSDIVAATVRVLESEEDLSGQSVNVSDGVPRRWHDILAHCRTTGAVPADREITFPDQSPPDTQSKRISNAKLRRLLPPAHHFVDLFAQ